MVLPSPFHQILTPSVAAGPWVFASPHSGSMLPPDLGADPTLDPRALRSAEDVDMDRLALPGLAHGAPLIACLASRVYVDVNRAPDDLDPAVVAGAPVEGAQRPRVRAGYGVIPRLTGNGLTIRLTPLTLAEAKARLAAVHAPYHAALARLMQAARGRSARAILIDWHSMPSGAADSVDVVLGDRHGSSCSPELTRRARAAFERRGWRVGLNRPYAGGYATQLWGRPDEGFHALQIEISRGRYLDEDTGDRSAGARAAETALAGVIGELLADGGGSGR